MGGSSNRAVEGAASAARSMPITHARRESAPVKRSRACSFEDFSRDAFDLENLRSEALRRPEVTLREFMPEA